MKGSVEDVVSLVLCAVEALDMEPRVASIGLSGARSPGEVTEEAEIVLPRASVVVKSHCFSSAGFGRADGVLELPPEYL